MRFKNHYPKFQVQQNTQWGCDHSLTWGYAVLMITQWASPQLFLSSTEKRFSLCCHGNLGSYAPP